MEKGLIHLYSGEGKGKTTAAIGLAIRAAGSEKKVLFCQFLKNNQSGELRILENIPWVKLDLTYPVTKFTRQMTLEEREKTIFEQQTKLSNCWKMATEQSFDLLILDELVAAISLGFIPLDEVLILLQNKPEGLEVILTGRNPPSELAALADYHSRICSVRHPYEKGLSAREGIEY